MQVHWRCREGSGLVLLKPFFIKLVPSLHHQCSDIFGGCQAKSCLKKSAVRWCFLLRSGWECEIVFLVWQTKPLTKPLKITSSKTTSLKSLSNTLGATCSLGECLFRGSMGFMIIKLKCLLALRNRQKAGLNRAILSSSLSKKHFTSFVSWRKYLLITKKSFWQTQSDLIIFIS